MLRFTIRELVFVTAVVAMALGWGVDHAKARLDVARARQGMDRAEQRAAIEREERHWAEVRAIKLYEQRTKMLHAAAERMTRDEFRETLAAIEPQ